MYILLLFLFSLTAYGAPAPPTPASPAAITPPKWAIDSSCDLIGVADPGNGLDPFITATDDLKEGMKESLQMAENAYKAMNEKADDKYVKDMLTLLFGTGAEFQAKFDAVKETFRRVTEFEKEHAQHRPMDQGWQDTMSNNDVMIFCSSDRIKPGPDARYRLDRSMKNTKYLNREFEDGTARGRCYDTNYNAAVPEGAAMMFTTPSDFIDKGAYINAPRPKNMADFMSPRPNIAFSIDVCTWFLHKYAQQGWPKITKERVIITQQPGFKGGITEASRPVDGLRNIGLSFLHELTHTNHGGRLDDKLNNLPPGTPSCYGWKCAMDLKDPDNADNVAMLGLALHLWTMGYYVDKDGNVQDIKTT